MGFLDVKVSRAQSGQGEIGVEMILIGISE